MDDRIRFVDTLAEVLDDLDVRDIHGVQRYRAMNQYLSMKARYRDVPLSGTFELTPLCNLDCRMCYVHLNQNRLPEGQRLLKVEEWMTIIRQSVEAGMIYASFTGGECLTYPGFRELYGYACSLGIRPDIMTNGCLLSEDMIDFLSKYPPGVMQISLYGSSEEAYEKVTGHRLFHQALAGIERAKDAGLNLTLAITPNRFMQADIPSLLALLHSLSLPYEIGSATLHARPETGRQFDEYAVEIDAYMHLLAMDEAYWADHPTEASVKRVPRYLPKNSMPLRGLPCGGAHSSFHVNWRGEMCPCIAFAQSVHCSILDRGFAQAWNEIRQRMVSYHPPCECAGCKLQPYCITCPGEKTMADFPERLNTYVCEKLKRQIAEGRIRTEGLSPNENIPC